MSRRTRKCLLGSTSGPDSTSTAEPSSLPWKVIDGRSRKNAASDISYAFVARGATREKTPLSGPTRLAAAWHGGNDIALENTWLWPDGEEYWQGRANGEAVGGLFTFWRGGEPNNSDGEDCALFNNNATGTWDDRGCGGGARLICERNPAPAAE